jgi:large subunit ribosomal protein L22
MNWYGMLIFVAPTKSGTKMAKVTAKLNNLRIAPRKTRLVANLIKGMNVDVAINQLDATIKGGSLPFKKLLHSAVANAENNFGLDKDNLYVFNAIVSDGPVLKRWKPKAFGRAGRILKRTSKLEITLEERVEGKGRKTKEQMEKEKKTREEKRKKELKQIQKEQEEREKEKGQTTKKKEKDVQEKEVSKATATPQAAKGKGTWKNKIFRRKSM